MPRGEGTWDRTMTAVDYTCMNPYAVCGSCIFQEPNLARWCPPKERQAKAALDRLVQVKPMAAVAVAA